MWSLHHQSLRLAGFRGRAGCVVSAVTGRGGHLVVDVRETPFGVSEMLRATQLTEMVNFYHQLVNFFC